MTTPRFAFQLPRQRLGALTVSDDASRCGGSALCKRQGVEGATALAAALPGAATTTVPNRQGRESQVMLRQSRRSSAHQHPN